MNIENEKTEIDYDAIFSDEKDENWDLYEKIAKKLEEKCEKMHAHDFYAKLRKMPKFCKRLSEIAEQETEDVTFKKIDLDLGRMQTMALDFFHQIDDELCENVWKVLEDTENTILHVKKPSENGGINAVGVLTKEDYHKNGKIKKKSVKIDISLAPRCDARGLVTVAHELAHTMEERVQKRIPQKVSAITEIVPMFFERIYADYLLKKEVIDQEEHDKVFAEIKNSFIRNAKTILVENYILSQLPAPISAKDLKSFVERYANSPDRKMLPKRIKIMIEGVNGKEYYGEKQFRYIIGEIVTQELYKDFQKEPLQTVEKVKKFAQNNAQITAQDGFELLLGENYEDRLGFKLGKSKRK